MRAAIGAAALGAMIGCLSFWGGYAVRLNADKPSLKGPLIKSIGPYAYRIAPGTVELKVEIYGTTSRAQCVTIDGERGRSSPGFLGGQGGDGGKGVFCGDAIAVFPGYAGEPAGAGRL